MTQEAIMKQLNEMTATMETSIQNWNTLLNILNAPHQVQTIALAQFIDLIQNQIGPQLEKAKASLEAVANADGVPKDLEERN
jgi:hypothetical protein